MSSRPRVLITGAARRIGRAIALELAAAGHDLVLHARTSAAEAQALAGELRALGATADVALGDLADPSACTAVFAQATAEGRALDALVNNASHFGYDALDSFDVATLDAHMHVNAAAPLLLTRALHAHLQQRGARGCVVNILDQKLANPNPDYLSYTLSKAALAATTRSLALALAPALRACAVSPGVTLPSGTMSEAEFAQAQRMTPLQRSSSPQDVARAVRFLLESPAITGVELLVDGGQHLQTQPRDVMFLARGANHA
ncbi:MAG: SDR family oxidoreductase [Burkholderiaceae bacterium]